MKPAIGRIGHTVKGLAVLHGYRKNKQRAKLIQQTVKTKPMEAINITPAYISGPMYCVISPEQSPAIFTVAFTENLAQDIFCKLHSVKFPTWEAAEALGYTCRRITMYAEIHKPQPLVIS